LDISFELTVRIWFKSVIYDIWTYHLNLRAYLVQQCDIWYLGILFELTCVSGSTVWYM